MEQLKIRPANHDDLKILLQFEQGVIAAERPFDPTLKEDPIQYYDLPAMIHSDEVELLVAEVDGLVVGSGYARIEKAKIFYKHPRFAYLGFMYVRPEYRGKGVNGAIIAALQTWTLSRGLTELRLEVYYDNLPAISAYKKMGFTAYIIEMRLGL